MTMAPAETFPVFSYQRFSDPGQEDGDSIRRQTALRDGWMKRNPGGRLDKSIGPLVTRGASGFHGDHRKAELGQFLALVEAKDPRIPPGSVLLIENMDRLSREKPVIATHLLTGLLVAGIRVVALAPDEIELTVDSDLFALLRGQLPQARGHDESKTKAMRAKEDMDEKKRLAREKKIPFTATLPAWVQRVGEVRNHKNKIIVPGKLELIPERVKAVKRIFELARDGNGLAVIVRTLIAEKWPPFGACEEYTDGDGRKRRRLKAGERFGSGKWTRTNVGNILSDRRATGEWQPYRRGANGLREPDGPPIPNFFPKVIEEAEWLQVRAGSEGRRWTRAKPTGHVNVFGKLLVNARDGEAYYCDTRSEPDPRTGKRVHTRLLKNLSGAEGRAPYASFPYRTFEKALLTMLAEVEPDVVTGRSDGSEELAALEAERDGIDAELASAKDYMARKGFSETIGDRIRSLEDRRAGLAPKLADARARVESPAGVTWVEAVNLMVALEKAKNPDDARRRLRTALTRTISEIRLLVVPRGRDRLCAAQVYFKESGRFQIYNILHRPAPGRARVRVGYWHATSYYETPDEGDEVLPPTVDLRWSRDVTKHAKVLLVYDPPANPDDFPEGSTIWGVIE